MVGLHADQQVGAAERGPCLDHGVLAAGDRIAGVRGARVRVVAGERGARGAHPGLTRLGAVARVPVAARGPVRDGRMLAAGDRIAGVRGAGIVVVAGERRPGGTSARLARLDPVAHAPVAARGPVRDRRVLAAGDRVARVGGAGVVVVAVEQCARRADAGLTGLGAVAGVAVAARGPVRHRRVLASGYRVAAIGGAGVAVVAVERRARRARAPLTRLGAVAHVAVTATGGVRPRR